METNTSFYYHKLDKIQYAISVLYDAKRVGIDFMLESLSQKESKAHDDLVQAEQAELAKMDGVNNEPE